MAIKFRSMKAIVTVAVAACCAVAAADEPWFGAPIPASGYDHSRPDCGMTAACIFDSPIAGVEKIGQLAYKSSSEIPETSNGSIGFEGLDRGLFDPDRTYDALAAAGIKWARVQTMWCRCEKEKGVFDFSALDDAVDNLARRGIRPWFSVTYGNTLYMTNCYTGAAVGCVPTLYGDECREAWCAYIRAMAKRYRGKVTHWEIWNEPDMRGFWQPSKPNAEEYLELVKLGGDIVRSEIPDAKIGGCTASAALTDWSMRFFELGGSKAVDFWCIHPYTPVPERLRHKHYTPSGATNDYLCAIKGMRDFVDANGGRNVEFWQGESGYPSWFPEAHWLFATPKGKNPCKAGWQSQANQAKWLLRRFVSDRQVGVVRSSFYQAADVSRGYSIATSTENHPAEHGILDAWTYRPKMSYEAFANWNALFATAKCDDEAKVTLSPTEDAGAKTVAAAFRTDGGEAFLYYTAFNFSGNYTGTCYTARCDAKLTVPATLAPKHPVLVDLLRGGVYAIKGRQDGESVVFEGLPLVDYPLAVLSADSVALAEDVNPFIGTGGDGHCFPAAAYPFGLVQAGPDTGWGTWDYCSGYRYEDRQITMFSQTHNPGGGCPDYADVGIMPFVGAATNVVSTFSHANETATPGYYAVTLDRGDIRVEIAAAEHSAIYRIQPGEARDMRFLVDLDYGMGNLTWAKKTIKPLDVRRGADGEIKAHLLRNGFVKNRHIGVDIRCHPAPVSVEELPAEPGVHAPKYILSFDLPQDGQLLVKLGLSTTDGDGAARNLKSEIPAWDFDAVRLAARAKWTDVLSRVRAECEDRDVQMQFATALYHMFLVPTNIADVDGRYRGADGKVAVAPTGRYYSELSLWDTFRGVHPFYTIALPEYVPHFVNSMLDHFDAAGFLPVLPKWGQDSQCMIATHAVAVIADAFFKGFKGVDWRRAYAAVKATLTKEHPTRKKENWDVLDKYGYYPCDLFKGEGVSRTLECSYDDWCAWKMAEKLGERGILLRQGFGGQAGNGEWDESLKVDAAFFAKRAENWRNVLDAKSGFMRGRCSDGSWREPFDPYRCGHESSWGGDFTEGNAWQWRWHVLQDPAGLVEALGGKEKTAALLDELFSLPSDLDKSHTSPDVTGLWGQYVQGNEPSHHIPYLYQYAGRPDRAAERIREICRRFYRNAPDGLCGNEDHGEMSAWYVFACLGFYPVSPSSGEFVIGAPQVKKVTLRLKETTFSIIAKNLSRENKYVKSVALNGKPLVGCGALAAPVIRYADIMAGGELVFEMTGAVTR